MFDNKRCRDIGLAVEAALKPLEKELGVGFHYKGGSFVGSVFDLRISAREVDAAGKEADDPYVEDFKRCAHRFGFKPDMLGAEFRANGKLMMIHGLKMKARRAPIIARDTQTGKLYRFKAEDVHRFLKAKDEQTIPINRPSNPD